MVSRFIFCADNAWRMRNTGKQKRCRKTCNKFNDYVIGPGDGIAINGMAQCGNFLNHACHSGSTGRQNFDAAGGGCAGQRKNSKSTGTGMFEKALSKYIQDPVVTIMVIGFVGPYSRQISCNWPGIETDRWQSLIVKICRFVDSGDRGSVDSARFLPRGIGQVFSEGLMGNNKNFLFA